MWSDSLFDKIGIWFSVVRGLASAFADQLAVPIPFNLESIL